MQCKAALALLVPGVVLQARWVLTDRSSGRVGCKKGRAMSMSMIHHSYIRHHYLICDWSGSDGWNEIDVTGGPQA